MTPEEQARRLVEEWWDGRKAECPDGSGHFVPIRLTDEAKDDLVRRLVPVFEGRTAARVAWERAERESEERAMGADDLRAKLERAEAERDALRAQIEITKACWDNEWKHRHDRAEAERDEMRKLLDPAVVRAARYLAKNADTHPHTCCLKCAAAITDAEAAVARLREALTALVQWYDDPRPAPRSHVALRNHDGERDVIYQRARAALAATEEK